MKRLLIVFLSCIMMISLSGCEGEYQVGDVSIAYHSTEKQTVDQNDLDLVEVPFVMGDLHTHEYQEVFTLMLPEDLILKNGKDNLGVYRYETDTSIKKINEAGIGLSYAYIEDGKYFCDYMKIENYDCNLDFEKFVKAYLHSINQDDVEREDSKQETYQCTVFNYELDDEIHSCMLVETKIENVYFVIEMVGTKQSAIASGEQLKQFMYDYGVMAAKTES